MDIFKRHETLSSARETLAGGGEEWKSFTNGRATLASPSCKQREQRMEILARDINNFHF